MKTTAAQARDALLEMSVLTADMIDAVYADPVIDDVWGVDVKGIIAQPAIVVYLNDREPDFEACEELELTF